MNQYLRKVKTDKLSQRSKKKSSEETPKFTDYEELLRRKRRKLRK